MAVAAGRGPGYPGRFSKTFGEEWNSRYQPPSGWGDSP